MADRRPAPVASLAEARARHALAALLARVVAAQRGATDSAPPVLAPTWPEVHALEALLRRTLGGGP